MSLPNTFSLLNGERVNLREMTVEDCSNCCALVPEHAADTWSLSDIETSLLNTKHHRCVVAEIVAEFGATIVAFAVFSEVLDELELLYIAVDSTSSRKGIAKGLLSKYLEIKRSVIQVVHLEVRESNIPAITLYKSLGFIQVGERKNYYSPSDTQNGKRENAQLFSIDLRRKPSD